MKLLLVAPSARQMSESARRAGYDFVALDYFGDLDTCEAGECHSLSHTYGDEDEYSERCLERLYRHVKDQHFTHLIYGSGFENHPDYVEEFEGKYTVLGNSAESLKRVRDWNNFFSTLKKAGVACPESQVIDREAIKDYEGDWIVKPINSGGGHGIFRLGENVDTNSISEKVLLQEYVEGNAISTSLISDGSDAVCLSTTEQIIGTHFNKYRYVGNITPLNADRSLLRQIEGLAEKVVSEFELVGSVGVDMMLARGVPHVIEVNPRFQGSLEVVERVCERSLIDLHVKACLGKLDVAKLKHELRPRRNQRYFGRKILFAERDLEFSVHKDEYDFVKDVPHYGELIRERNPICTVLASGRTKEECYTALGSNEMALRRRLTQ